MRSDSSRAASAISSRYKRSRRKGIGWKPSVAKKNLQGVPRELESIKKFVDAFTASKRDERTSEARRSVDRRLEVNQLEVREPEA